MRRCARLLAGVCLTIAAFSGCRDILPQNRFLRPRTTAQKSLSTADARHKFSHARHEKILAQEGATCADCHRFDALIETGDPSLASVLSGTAQYPGGAACHFCHGPSETRLASAPSACLTCHANLVPLLPANHEIAWLRVHASVASADPAECQSCHRDSFCVNCHQNRDSILTFMHERNYLSIHSVDARANPIQCGSCHREDFCIGCHAQTVR